MFVLVYEHRAHSRKPVIKRVDFLSSYLNVRGWCTVDSEYTVQSPNINWIRVFFVLSFTDIYE